MRTPKALIVLLLTALLVGCASSHGSFDHLDARSERVFAAVLEGIDRVNDDGPPPEVRNRRLAYYRWVQSAHIDLRALVLRSRLTPWTPEEHQRLDALFRSAYDLLEACVAYPGEMDEAGNFVKGPDGPELRERVAEIEALLEAPRIRAGRLTRDAGPPRP